MMTYKRCLGAALVGLTLLGAGCSKPKPQQPVPVTDAAKPPTQPADQGSNPPPPPPEAGNTPAVQKAMEQSVALPDGKSLTLANPGPAAVGGMQVRLEVLGAAKDAPDAVGTVLGNHVEDATAEQVTLPSGPATLAVAVRGEPAASGSDQKTTEVWLMAFRKHPDRPDMQVAYCIVGVVTGDLNTAKQTMLQLGQKWTLPSQ